MLRSKSLKRNPAYVISTTPHAAATRFCSLPLRRCAHFPLSFTSISFLYKIPPHKNHTESKKITKIMASKFLLTFAICRLIVAVGLTLNPTDLPRLGIDGRLTVDPSHIEEVSGDFGGMHRAEPLAVLHPATALDVARLVRAAYESADGFAVSARGHGHSINGQSQTSNGVVIDMSGGGGSRGLRLKPAGPRIFEKERYVDVWGGELWIDVLRHTLEYGLAPKSWTDYLYLSVGGTLSNAGISGQAFNHGPQIGNVHEVDVVTGKGDLMTCSEEQNEELFHAVLGGLGQFGIITRARIALEPAPKMVRWIRVLYSNFSEFTHDQEFLISLQGKPASEKFDYVEGFVIVDEGLINNWRSSFFSPSNPVKISSLGGANGGVLYCLEIVKNYDESSAGTLDEVFILANTFYDLKTTIQKDFLSFFSSELTS